MTVRLPRRFSFARYEAFLELFNLRQENQFVRSSKYQFKFRTLAEFNVFRRIDHWPKTKFRQEDSKIFLGVDSPVILMKPYLR